MVNFKKLLRIPDYHYSAAQITRWLWQAWQGNRLQAVINAVIGLLMVAVSLAQVWAFQNAIDVASGSRHGSLLWAVVIMGLLILADFALNIASIWVKNLLGVKAQNRMQQRMLDYLLRSEWHGREERHSGDVLNRLEFDVVNVVTFLTETIPSTLSVIAMFVGAFVYLFSMDHVLALITVAIIPLFVLLSKVYIGKMRNLTRLVRDADSRVQSVMQETVQHRMLIKIMESTQAMVDLLEGTQSVLRRNVARRTLFSVFASFMVNLGFAMGFLLAFAWAAVRMSMHTLTFGGMMAFVQLVNKIQSPARSLTKLVPAFVSVFTAAERLMELEENPLEEQGEPIRIPAPCGLKLTDVTFRYSDKERLILHHLTFTFAPGSCTAVMGETGAGKTTLIRLIMALLNPVEGHVTIYSDATGSPIEQDVTPRHRCNFVYVPQGNTLLSGTIRDNLLLGDANATEEQMRKALELSCADFVYQLPQQLDTVCSEAGGGLSEGQAQRVGIARSLLRNRSIMLFDEVTSALDHDTEERLLKNLTSLPDKTLIFITHRPAVIRYCSQTLTIKRIQENEQMPRK